MRPAIQLLTMPPLRFRYDAPDRRDGRIWSERVWANAIHRVAAEGISPEQAVDEAIARIKEILSE